jgi:DNA-binding Xre family transcriptional regulator
MENRQKTIEAVWQALQNLPRMKVNELLAKMGLAKSMYDKLQDQEAKKVFLGLVTRLDDAALGQVMQLVRA